KENGNLWGFDIHWDFNKFLQASWQKETIKNFALLSKAVTLFNQSHLVGNSSAFLIRYNIIEICDKQKQDKVKFPLIRFRTTKNLASQYTIVFRINFDRKFVCLACIQTLLRSFEGTCLICDGIFQGLNAWPLLLLRLLNRGECHYSSAWKGLYHVEG